MGDMLRPLIAIDLNSRIDYLKLYNFVEKLLRKFKVVDAVFIIDDKSILEIDSHKVFKVSDSYSLVEVVKELKGLSERKGNLDLGSLVTLKRELNRSVVVVVSDRKAKANDNLLFVFDGRRIKTISGN